MNSPADLGTRLGDTNRETDGGVSFRGGGKRGRKGGVDGLFTATVKPVKRRIRLPTKWFLTPGFCWILGHPPRAQMYSQMGKGHRDSEELRDTEDHTAREWQAGVSSPKCLTPVSPLPKVPPWLGVLPQYPHPQA